jgi:hypothetical protein
MIKHEEFAGLLTTEFPSLAPLLKDGYLTSNAILCFARHAQTGIETANLPEITKCFSFVERCLRDGETELKSELETCFFHQLTLDTTARAEDSLWWLAPFHIWRRRRTARAVLAIMSPALLEAWNSALGSRGGRLTDLDFIERTGREFPALKQQPGPVAFVINPYLAGLREQTQGAIDSGDSRAANRLFAFLMPFCMEGIESLRWWLMEEFLKKLVWRGPRADEVKRRIPRPFQIALEEFAAQQREAEKQAATAQAEAGARRAKNHPLIPDRYRELVRRMDELTGVEFSPADSETLDWLRQRALPQAVVEFYATANPADVVSGGDIDLYPGLAVGRTDLDDWTSSLTERGLIPFATGFSGDVYCFNLRPPSGSRLGLIVQVSHEWGCPADGLRSYIKNAEATNQQPKQDSSLEQEYWEMFWESAVTPYAKSFEQFLKKFVAQIESDH